MAQPFPNPELRSRETTRIGSVISSSNTATQSTPTPIRGCQQASGLMLAFHNSWSLPRFQVSEHQAQRWMIRNSVMAPATWSHHARDPLGERHGAPLRDSRQLPTPRTRISTQTAPSPGTPGPVIQDREELSVKRFKASDGHCFEVGSPHKLIRRVPSRGIDHGRPVFQSGSPFLPMGSNMGMPTHPFSAVAGIVDPGAGASDREKIFRSWGGVTEEGVALRRFSSTAEPPLDKSRTRILKRKHDEVDDVESPAEEQQSANMEVEDNGNNREDGSQRAVVLTRGYFDPVPSRSSPTTEGRVDGAPRCNATEGVLSEEAVSVSSLEQEDDELQQEEDDAQEEVSIWLHGTDDWWRF